MVLETISGLGILGLIALIAGIIYVVLASRTNYYAWHFGILSCAIIAYEDFTRFQLFADGALQVFYVAMGLYALAEWRKKDVSGELRIVTLSRGQNLRLITGMLIATMIFGVLLNHYTPAELPYLDTMTSVFAVMATWLLVRRVKENWWYWIFINAVYLYIYGRQGAWFYVILTLVYLVVSVYGARQWDKKYEVQRKNENDII